MFNFCRKSITSTLSSLPVASELDESEDIGSIGSAGSLAKRLPHDDFSGNFQKSNLIVKFMKFKISKFNFLDPDDDSLDDDDWSPLQLFLVANGLGEYIGKFVAEKIDLESLVLLTDEDLSSLGLPLGPRRKLTIAIENRRKALAAPGQVHDSQL